MKRKSLRERVLCLIIGMLFATAFVNAQNRIQEIVRTVDKTGSPICFFIDVVCTTVNTRCCGTICEIDGEIYFIDCSTQQITPVIPAIEPITYHLNYVNGGWQWGHVCDSLDNGDCITCKCAQKADTWAKNPTINLNGYQDLVNLAQYLNTCCAPAVPNPIECDSSIVDGPYLCTRFKRWCCNGILLRLEFALFDCGYPEDTILTDGFSVHLHHPDAPKDHSDSYDIFADPDNPCALSEEQRRMILRMFLENQSPDPCISMRQK